MLAPINVEEAYEDLEKAEVQYTDWMGRSYNHLDLKPTSGSDNYTPDKTCLLCQGEDCDFDNSVTKCSNCNVHMHMYCALQWVLTRDDLLLLNNEELRFCPFCKDTTAKICGCPSTGCSIDRHFTMINRNPAYEFLLNSRELRQMISPASTAMYIWALSTGLINCDNKPVNPSKWVKN